MTEFGFVPEAEASCWKGAWGGYTGVEQTEMLELLSAAIDFAFNPSDDDSDQGSILERALLDAAAYIAAQPCTCTEGDSCARCHALGRDYDQRRGR